MRRHIVEDVRWRQNQTPRKREVSVPRTTPPLAFWIPDRNPPHWATQTLCIAFGMVRERQPCPVAKPGLQPGGQPALSSADQQCAPALPDTAASIVSTDHFMRLPPKRNHAPIGKRNTRRSARQLFPKPTLLTSRKANPVSPILPRRQYQCRGIRRGINPQTDALGSFVDPNRQTNAELGQFDKRGGQTRDMLHCLIISESLVGHLRFFAARSPSFPQKNVMPPKAP